MSAAGKNLTDADLTGADLTGALTESTKLPASHVALTWHCAACGSTDIQRDAIVVWIADRNAYEIVSVLDDTWCETCKSKDPNDDGDPQWGVPA